MNKEHVIYASFCHWIFPVHPKHTIKCKVVLSNISVSIWRARLTSSKEIGIGEFPNNNFFFAWWSFIPLKDPNVSKARILSVSWGADANLVGVVAYAIINLVPAVTENEWMNKWIKYMRNGFMVMWPQTCKSNHASFSHEAITYKSTQRYLQINIHLQILTTNLQLTFMFKSPSQLID